MKITAVDARVLRRLDWKFRWNEEIAPRYMDHLLVNISTDEGHEGICITYLMSPGEMESALPDLRSYLIGRDPHDIEAIPYKLTNSLRNPGAVASTIDICLWDLLGKHHNEPASARTDMWRRRPSRAWASTWTGTRSRR